MTEKEISGESKNRHADKSTNAEFITPFDFTPQAHVKPAFTFKFRAAHFFIAAFLVVASISAWFVLNAKSVSIQVEPSTARVEIQGFHIALGQRSLMLPGDYVLTLSYPGYFDEQSTLTVGLDQAQNFPFQLQELPGTLNINVTAADGEKLQALVTANGEPLGHTPLEEVELPSGNYVLKVSADRYLPLEQTVMVEGRRTLNEFDFSLAPAWGVISLQSQPAGADVLVDGQLLGNTPYTGQILRGNHDLMLKLTGHKAWQQKLEIEPGLDYDIPVQTLVPADGLAFIRSNPSGANVTVNGEYAGLTPLEITLAPNRSHELNLFKSGFEPLMRRIETRSAQELDLEISLAPITSMVSIIVDPPQAQLFIDGEAKGNANQRIELLAASQTIEIRQDGYIPYSTNFISRPGLEQELRVQLKSQEQARLDSIEPVIRTVAGQRLDLFYPDQFTMGASRREAGRRANEDLREIKLERPFYLSPTQVTNEQYKRFKAEHSSGTMQNRSLDLDTQPVVQVSWHDAALYCNWLSEQEGIDTFYNVEDGKVTGFDPNATGYRLPTEAEWEWAARTDGSGNTLRYSWGANLPPPADAGNFADQSVSSFMGQYLIGFNDGFAGTSPVGAFSANARGMYDMAGNVSEWVHDFYGTSLSLSSRVEVDPMGPDSGAYHVVKGSSWAHSTVTELRLSYRDFADLARNDLGFRIARYLEN